MQNPIINLKNFTGLAAILPDTEKCKQEAFYASVLRILAQDVFVGCQANHKEAEWLEDHGLYEMQHSDSWVFKITELGKQARELVAVDMEQNNAN